MKSLSPSPNPQQRPPRHRDKLGRLLLLAVLLALLPVYCIADVVLHVLAPSNEPFKDVGTQMDPTIYARWTEGFKLPALNPEAVRAADAEERRRAQPPAIIPGITAIATVVEVIQPPVEVVIVPTPTIPARNPSSTTTSVVGVVRTPSPRWRYRLDHRPGDRPSK